MSTRFRTANAVAVAVLTMGLTTPSWAEPSAEPLVRRVSGAERVETAVALSVAAAPVCPEQGCGPVVIARADLAIDALAGGPLAASLGAPLLLTDPAALSAATATEIRRLGADRAVLLGGTAALSQQVADDLRAVGVAQVDRVDGATRYHTAAEVARRLDPDHVLVAAGGITRGTDALSAGPLAAASGAAVLLAEADFVPPATEHALDDLDVRRITIVGGTDAISQETELGLADADRVVERLGGATRHETAVAVAKRSAVFDAGPATVYLADAAALPDALAASVAAARQGGALLLIDGADAPASTATADYLEWHRPLLRDAVVVGGEATVTSSSYAFLTQLLRRQGHPYEAFTVEASAPPGPFIDGDEIVFTARSCNSSAAPYAQRHPPPLHSFQVVDQHGAVVADNTRGFAFPDSIDTSRWAAGECITSTATWRQNTGPFSEGGALPQGPRAAPGTYRLRIGWRGVEDGARFTYPPVYSAPFTLE